MAAVYQALCVRLSLCVPPFSGCRELQMLKGAERQTGRFQRAVRFERRPGTNGSSTVPDAAKDWCCEVLPHR